jgi:hypothetical protein
MCLSNYPIIDHGVIFVENDVWLEGTLNEKKISVVAANLGVGNLRNVYIGKDIRYAHANLLRGARRDWTGGCGNLLWK